MLIGASDRAAIRRLEENAFALDGVSEIRSNRYPVDAVVAQHQPPDGNGQRVSLLVNRGERGLTFVMPDLIGVRGETASEVLRGHGFRVTVVADHPYPGVPAGIVLRQSPEAGFQIAPGEPISLEVSR
jgi:serine/threonine-protein kinase